MKKRNLCTVTLLAAAAAAALGLLATGCEVNSPDETQITVSPGYIRLSAGQSATFRATGWNRYQWSISPNVGRLSATTGDQVTYTAIDASGSTVTLTANASLAAAFYDGPGAKAATNAPGGTASIAPGTATIVVD